MDPIEFNATLVFEETMPNSGSYKFTGTEFSSDDNSLQIKSLTGTVRSDSGYYWVNLNVETSAGVFNVTHQCTERPFLMPFNDSLLERAQGCNRIRMFIFQSIRREGSGFGLPCVYDAKASFVIK